MKRKILVAALISALGAVTLASNCDEVTTETSTDQVTVVISVSSPIIATGDTLAGDTVQFAVELIQGSDTVPAVGRFSSDDPTIVEIIDENTGEATFTGLGTATVSVEVDDASLSGSLTASMKVNVATTFLVNVGGPASPVMGDTAQYTVTVTDTKPDPDTAVSVTGQDFVSSNGSVLQILNAATGEAFARDIGQADVRVTFTQPTLPNAMLEGSLSVDITEERFYGTALPDSSGAFGDTVRLTATAVHTFTDSTRVSFSNGAAGYVDSVGPTQLRFVVGAGNDSTAPAPLTLVNLLDESALPRATVETKFNFTGLGGIDDAFEPNDALPLNTGLEITALPFVQLLSSDPRKMAPADTNFFYIDATSGAITVDIIAEWQQDANLDFFVCNGDANPPTMQVAGCARLPTLNDQDPPTVRSKEEQMSVVLGPIVHIIAFYCVDCSATVPLTYRVTIQ